MHRLITGRTPSEWRRRQRAAWRRQQIARSHRTGDPSGLDRQLHPGRDVRHPNLRRERQLEGIADAKARGVYKGRKASIDPAKIKKLKAEGVWPSAIAKALKIGRASVYRALMS
jgi:hypothetical protein